MLFLDEVSDLPLSAQAKLCAIQDLAVGVRRRQQYRVDIRIVAAPIAGCYRSSNDNCFDPGSFYRLSGVDVRIQTLRARTADIWSWLNNSWRFTD